MLSTGVSGGLGAGVRHFVYLLLLTCCWAVLALCAAQSAFGQQPSAAPPESAGPFSAAGVGTGTRPISGLWQFHLGDDPAWAQAGFDDRSWEQLPADQPWGDAGHPRYTGFAWYRRQIALDPAEKTPLGLLLPPLDSVAEVYWNGVKVGGIGTMPPNPSWFFTPQPVAVPLPSVSDAKTGELAIRLWARPLDSTDPPDTGGLQASPLLGYRSLIGKTADSWVEHRLRTRALGYAALLLCLFTSIAALLLWVRSPLQWVLLCAGLYFGGYAVSLGLRNLLSPSWVSGSILGQSLGAIIQIASIALILFLADLPRRPGLKGFRFWARACLVFCCGIMLVSVNGVVQVLIFVSHPAVGRYNSILSQIVSYGTIAFQLTLLAACLVLRRPTLARLLFMIAVVLDIVLNLFSTLTQDYSNRLSWLMPIVYRPLLQIYGSSLSVFTVSRTLVLLTVVYAVWDQLSQQVARQRFVDAEMKAAQEVQQVLVPAAAERQAPGYEVSSVYRPASEVGGDFFQIIPLQGDGTLIVAGDVSGKGLRAAMTVSLVVGTLRTLAEYDPTPVAVLAGLNRRLIGRTQGGFVTCCAVRIDAAGRATMANAGHCQPYLDGREVELPNGLPLGIVEDAEYEEIAVDVSHGQQLTLLSDGVVEARNPHGELYGFDRLHQLMQGRPSAEHVAETAVGFGQEDDITVLTVTRLAVS